MLEIKNSCEHCETSLPSDSINAIDLLLRMHILNSLQQRSLEKYLPELPGRAGSTSHSTIALVALKTPIPAQGVHLLNGSRT
jgi:hypothetical protein